MKKPTIKDKVLYLLQKNGSIDNYFAINTRLTIRLGDVIFRLKEEGRVVIDDDKSGYINGTKNWLYVVKPFQKKDYYVQGKLAASVWK